MKLFDNNKLFGYFAILATLFLVSCQNDEVEIIREDAKINILLNNVLSPFTAYTQKNMDMFEWDEVSSKIVVRAFVYDDNGHLINKFSKKVTK